jgi:hypothetical protein
MNVRHGVFLPWEDIVLLVTSSSSLRWLHKNCCIQNFGVHVLSLLSSNWPLRHIADIHLCQADIIWFFWNNRIPYTAEIGAKHDGDIFPTDPTKISKRSGTLLKRQKR